MANGFQNIPDWFSWENQGAGIAVAQLTNARPRDLLVMMVDNPPGQNGGLYRVGKHLDGSGNVIGGWTPWIDVPDWFPWENRGAGIAVTDLDGNGQLDIIVFMIDHALDQNHAYYKAGKHLDADGNVTAGWSNWIPIPNWPAGDNQYGNIAIADVNGSGRPDLLVLRIDHPSQPDQNNSASYQIAWDLDAHGMAGRWSNWIQVPDWFSQDNQGAGIAVADLKNRGQLDLVIFQVDNPPELNQAFYKIGENLDAQGIVRGAWTAWRGIPGWFSWENQGGGMASVLHDGHRDLVVVMVDNPPQVNSGQYRILELADDPQRVGKWEVLKFDSEVLAIHAALLPTGKVLFLAGSGNNPTRFASSDFGDTTKKIWTSVVWDPTITPAPGTDDNFFHPNTLRDAGRRPLDFFCGGDSFLPDGRLLSAGGTHKYSNGSRFLGLAEAALFNPQTQQWAQVPSMAHGRWYPTLVTLHDGRILVASGLNENGNINTTLDIYDPTTNSWQTPLQVPPGFPGLPLYAHLFQLQDGRLFFTGGKMNDDDRDASTALGPCLIDISTNPVQIFPVGGLKDPATRNQSASVLLPPAQDQKVMIMGGGPNDKAHPATASVDIIGLSNLNQPNLAYHPAQPMNFPRMHLNAVLLPDHTVFVSGGAPKQEMKTSASLQSEIYDPATNTWQLAAIAQIPRLYHSIALLLPDGRVIAAGGNPDRGKQVQWEPPDPNEELHMEVYSPPYLFRSPRPVIDTAPEQIHYGQSFTIHSSQAGNIQWVSLLKNGVTTHSFNTGQRLVDLTINAQGGGMVTVTTESNPNVTPPGWYMLFIIDQNKVPSVAKWVHLT